MDVERFARSLRQNDEHRSWWTERLIAQVRFADRLCVLHPQHEKEWRERIAEVEHVVAQELRDGSVDSRSLTLRSEELLAPIGRAAKEYTLLCVSHAHIDMNWMWSWPETVAVTHDTFQTMLALMDEFPDFVYSQSQASTYRLIEKYDPAMFEVIRRRVSEGRWEVTASQWVEGDKNMVCGESICRHLLYTRAYFQERFGLAPEDVQVDFEPDTFGHPATLPGILARGGVRYYYHCRGSRGPHLYWWVGPDGSRLLVFNDVTWYMCAIGPQIAEPLFEFSRRTGLKFMPVLYGVGDHGGGPTRRDLKRIIAMNSWPVYPNVEFSSLHNFFRRAEAEAHDLPEVRGERNFIFTGCYTSQARQKQANRHGENLLYTAEAVATIGDLVVGVTYPRENLEDAWKRVLFNQFHDILPGSGTRDTRDYALGSAQEMQAAAGMARTNALRALAARVDTASLRRLFAGGAESELAMGAGVGYATGDGGESAFSAARSDDRAFLVFNPLPYPRADVVSLTLWNVSADEARLAAMSADGEVTRVQVLDKGRYWGHEYLRVAFPAALPPLGYRVYRLAEWPFTAQERDPWAGPNAVWRTVSYPDYVLENEFIRVQVDPASGGLRSLWDKRTGREWTPEGGLCGILQYCVEANGGMTAWVIGQFLRREELVQGGTLKLLHSGPYVQTLRWARTIGQSKVELDISVRQGVPRVEYRLRVDWREIGHPERGIPHLRVRFPLAAREPRPRYEIPFGSLVRDLRNGEEVPSLRWADLSDADGAGVTLVNSSKYGFSVEGNALGMTLLRSSIDPDPLPDLGEHVIEYALVPHGSEWTVGDCMRVGEEWNLAPVATSCDWHDGDLPSALSFVRVRGCCAWSRWRDAGARPGSRSPLPCGKNRCV